MAIYFVSFKLYTLVYNPICFLLTKIVLRLIQISFIAFVGNSYAGDIAIDDVEMLQGLCPPPGISDLYCSFEDDLACQYQQDSTDDFNWIHTSGGKVYFCNTL